MVFSSLTFLLYFLPISALLVCLSRKVTVQNYLLSLLSLVFYTWGDLSLSWVLLSSVTVNYFFGIAIENNQNSPGKKKNLITIALVVNLLLLFFFKYANFGGENLNSLLLSLHLPAIEFPFIPLPLGISFFTFHCISYLVDIYRGKAQALKDPVVMFLYIALFPQLVAGPIIRFHEIASQFITRQTNADSMAEGMRRFVFGLSKKVLIANPVGAIADKAFAVPINQVGWDIAWLGACCYAIQIFFDFSGYSDMAIGLGKMFGFSFPENFNYPYMSLSIREFWRRWHITLSSWFRDYVYIPLGGNRGGKLLESRNLILVFFLCGLWHGASWNFVIWGLFHGLFLSLERTNFCSTLLTRTPKFFTWLYTMVVVLIGWVFFRLESLPEALTYISAMSGFHQPVQTYPALSLLDSFSWFCIALGVIFSAQYSANIFKISRLFGKSSIPLLRLTRTAVTVTLLAVSTIELTASSSNPFIYFRF